MQAFEDSEYIRSFTSKLFNSMPLLLCSIDYSGIEFGFQLSRQNEYKDWSQVCVEDSKLELHVRDHSSI
jgi:hypothetical protein